MKLSIKNSIYQAIIRGKWLDISYVNKKGESTNYYIGIKDIDIDKGTIICDIFNPFKSNYVLADSKNDTFIYIRGIFLLQPTTTPIVHQQIGSNGKDETLHRLGTKHRFVVEQTQEDVLSQVASSLPVVYPIK